MRCHRWGEGEGPSFPPNVEPGRNFQILHRTSFAFYSPNIYYGSLFLGYRNADGHIPQRYVITETLPTVDHELMTRCLACLSGCALT